MGADFLLMSRSLLYGDFVSISGEKVLFKDLLHKSQIFNEIFHDNHYNIPFIAS